jgi:hypothetical protein
LTIFVASRVQLESSEVHDSHDVVVSSNNFPAHNKIYEGVNSKWRRKAGSLTSVAAQRRSHLHAFSLEQFLLQLQANEGRSFLCSVFQC